MTILKPAPVSANQFTWDASSRTYVAEISDLQIGFGQVYDDACDEGFTLVSKAGDREIVFAVYTEHRDAEGDIQFWDFTPANSKPCGFSVRIFND